MSCNDSSQTQPHPHALQLPHPHVLQLVPTSLARMTSGAALPSLRGICRMGLSPSTRCKHEQLAGGTDAHPASRPSRS